LDSQAEIRWGKWLIKHHAKYLWMHELPAPSPCPEMNWASGARLFLSPAYGFVEVDGDVEKQFSGASIRHRSALPPDLENLKSVKNNIKEIMRLSGIPTWLRDAVPLLFLDQKLAAVGDWWLAPEFRQKLKDSHRVYRWQPDHALLKKIQSVGHNVAVDPAATLV